MKSWLSWHRAVSLKLQSRVNIKQFLHNLYYIYISWKKYEAQTFSQVLLNELLSLKLIFCHRYSPSSLISQAGGLSALRTLRVGYQPHVWKFRMTLMISPSRQKKVEFCLSSNVPHHQSYWNQMSATTKNLLFIQIWDLDR